MPCKYNNLIAHLNMIYDVMLPYPHTYLTNPLWLISKNLLSSLSHLLLDGRDRKEELTKKKECKEVCETDSKCKPF